MMFFSLMAKVIGIYLFGMVITWYIARWIARDKSDIPIIAVLWFASLPLMALNWVWRRILSPFLSRGVESFDWFIFKRTAQLTQSDEFGELWSGPSPDENRPFKAIRVQDSTGIHWIRVHPQIETAKQGVHWTYHDSGIKTDDFKPVRY